MNKDEKEQIPGVDRLRVDRSIVVAGNAYEKSDEKAFWRSKSPQERLEAIEYYREIAYGHDACSARLQRVFEVANFPPR